MAKVKKKKNTSKSGKKKIDLPSWPLSISQSFLLFTGLSVLLTFILFSQYLFGPWLYIFNDVGSDTLTVFFPNLAQSARYFQEVGWPGWSFYFGLGANFYPGYILNPFYWVYLPMDASAIAHTIAWVQAGVLILTGIVFYKFLKEAQFEPIVCVIGAMVYTFGGYAVLGNSWYGHAFVIFWMTLAFYGFELLLRRKIWWVFPIPFIFLLGPRGYFLVLFMAIYGLVRMLDYYGYSWKDIFHGYKRMIIGGFVAILLTAPFVGGKWNKYANSPRVTGNVSYQDRLSDAPMFRMSPADHNVTAVMRIFSNNMLGSGVDYEGWRNYLEAPCFYMGLISLLFVFQFFILAEKRRKWIYGAFLMIWLIMIVFPWFRFAFYGFAGNYYKGALSLFIPFSFFFVGLLGLQEIVKGKPLNKLVLFISALFWLTLLWYPYEAEGVVIDASMQAKVSGFILAYTGILWAYSEGMLRKFILPGLVSIMALEVLVLSWPCINEREPIPKTVVENKQYHFDDTMEAVEKIHRADDDLFYRMDKVYGSIKTGYNDGQVQGFFGSKSYQSHNHKNYVEFLDKTGVINAEQEANTRWLVGVARTNILHGLFSIKYLFSDTATESRVDRAIYDRIETTGMTTSWKNNYYIPFGIPIQHYITEAEFEALSRSERKRVLYFAVIGNETEAWTKNMQKLQLDGFSFYGTAIKDRTNYLAGQAMTMDHFSHKKIKGHIDVETNTMMFFSIPFDSGWQAFVNGKKASLEMIDFGFTGLLLEPGHSEIELKYIPPMSRKGWIGFALGIVSILLLYVFRRKF